jgi:phosphoglycerate dehydrogenase-like enzyme
VAKKVAMFGPDTPAVRERVAEFNAIAKKLGGDVEFKFVDVALPFEEVVKLCESAIALHPAAYRQLSKEQITELARRTPTVKLFQAPSAGTDFYDKPGLKKLGVDVCNAGGHNAVAVSEHAIWLMVGVYRKLDKQMACVRAGTWSDPIMAMPESEFHTLVGKRIGIIGLGRIGSRVAKRLYGWECEVVYHDILDFPKEYVEATHAKRVDMKTLLSSSDIVTVHVPLDPPTRHLISEKELALMKPTSILINTCRGPVVDEAALIRALQKKVIFGAGLDVVEEEPIRLDNPLLKLENVIITPHQATRAIESSNNAKAFVVENIVRVARGEKPQSVVEPV